MKYRVKTGDTLWGLAQRYGTTVEAIQRANGMGNKTTIYVGQIITIPV